MTKNTTGRMSFSRSLRAQFELVLARPLIGVPGGQFQLLRRAARLRSIHEAAVIVRVQVEIDVAGKRAVFVANHGGSARKRNRARLRRCGICAPDGRGDQHRRSCSRSSRKSRCVADVDRIALAPLDVLGDVLAADAGGDRPLHIGDGQSIAGGFGAVHFDIDVKALRRRVRRRRPHLGRRREDLLDLRRRYAESRRASGPESSVPPES